MNVQATGSYFVQLGEQEGIGATSGFLSHLGEYFFLDSGTAFKKTKGHPIQKVTIPAYELIAGKKPKVIIISHSHLDHVGYLPRVASLFPDATIVMTYDCFRELKIMLPDADKIAGQEAQKAHDLGYKPPAEAFSYSEMEKFFTLEGTPRLILINAPCELKNLPGLNGWSFKFHSSGHTVGAVSTFMTAPDGWTCYWTADAKIDNQEICDGVNTPEGWENPDVFIGEGTNGALPMKYSRKETWDQYDEIVLRTLAQGGHVLCPAFAMNRLSNVACHSTELGEKVGFVTVIDGIVGKGPIGERIIDIEMGAEKVAKLIEEGLLILIEQDGYGGKGTEQRNRILDGDYGPAVIISSSATMENGWSSYWAKQLLPGRKNSVILTGYVFPDSIAEQVLKLRKGRSITLEHYNKKYFKIIKTFVNCACDVYSLSLSAHDYQQGLVKRVLTARPKDLVIVHHTSDTSYTAYSDALKAEYARLNLTPPRIVRGGHGIVIPL